METHSNDMEESDQVHTLRVATGLDWFDENTGGGLSKSSKVWIRGDVGTGKTMLAMQIAARSQFQRVLWYSIDPASHSHMLLERFSLSPAGAAKFTIEEQTSLAALPAVIGRLNPDLVVVDGLERLEGDLDLEVEAIDVPARAFAAKSLCVASMVSGALIMTGSSNAFRPIFDMDIVIETRPVGRAFFIKNQFGQVASDLRFAVS